MKQKPRARQSKSEHGVLSFSQLRRIDAKNTNSPRF